MDGLTRNAMRATLHCLTGCAIGEVAGMAIGTALGWGDLQTVALAVALAFLFGYALTVGPIAASGVPMRSALALGAAADTVSIGVMEILDNAIVLAVPGAMDAHLSDELFWGALALALVMSFALTVPVNRALIARGRGHALAHSHHGD
jgi:hypothetical protein